jgi:hypothetical protein
MVLFSMSQEKVNPSLSPTDSTSSADEGLRVLARMIARRLMTIKTDEIGVGEKDGSQSQGTTDGKQVQASSNCKRLGAKYPEESGDADG